MFLRNIRQSELLSRPLQAYCGSAGVCGAVPVTWPTRQSRTELQVGNASYSTIQRNVGRNPFLRWTQTRDTKLFFSKEETRFSSVLKVSLPSKSRSRSRSRSIHLAPIKFSSANVNDLSKRGWVVNHEGTSLLCPIFLNAEKHQQNVAIIDRISTLTYSDILRQATLLCTEIIHYFGNDEKNKLNGRRIALLTENDACYVIGQFATWLADGVSVPLCQDHPVSMWEYFLENSQCSLVLASSKFSEKIVPVAEKLKIPTITLTREMHSHEGHGNNTSQWSIISNTSTTPWLSEGPLSQEFGGLDESINKMPALIIYTSGTTGRPKGVVLTHGNIMAMVSNMVESWAWTKTDVLLHILPLHHVHGIVNCLLTPLACGAVCVMEPKFDAKRIWNVLTQPAGPNFDKRVNMFMAVPTVYTKLIEYFDNHITTGKEDFTADFVRAEMVEKIRLMVSGSAALPSPVSDRWFEITGHRLLERYGMTEVGMALTNSLHGDRIAGAVGMPFPSVEVRIVKALDDSSDQYEILAEGNCREAKVTEGFEGEPGELLIKGPSVFKEYLNNQKATTEAFTKDGWFKTGDTAVYADGVFRIVGRTSVDIIKSGGYKISALDVERHLLAHQEILDCAVVGLPDATWGQKVAAVLTVKGGGSIEASQLREWAKDYLAPYQIPTVIKFLPTIPRNVMGKVNKKELVTTVFPEFFEDC